MLPQNISWVSHALQTTVSTLSYPDAWLMMGMLLCVTQPSWRRLDPARSDGRDYTSALMSFHSMSDYRLYCVPCRFP